MLIVLVLFEFELVLEFELPEVVFVEFGHFELQLFWHGLHVSLHDFLQVFSQTGVVQEFILVHSFSQAIQLRLQDASQLVGHEVHEVSFVGFGATGHGLSTGQFTVHPCVELQSCTLQPVLQLS